MQEFEVRFGDPENISNDRKKLVTDRFRELVRNDAQRSIPTIARDVDATAEIERLLYE